MIRIHTYIVWREHTKKTMSNNLYRIELYGDPSCIPRESSEATCVHKHYSQACQITIWRVGVDLTVYHVFFFFTFFVLLQMKYMKIIYMRTVCCAHSVYIMITMKMIRMFTRDYQWNSNTCGIRVKVTRSSGDTVHLTFGSDVANCNIIHFDNVVKFASY